MDLFSSNLSVNQRLNEIKEKYKKLLEVDQNGKGKFTIIKGNKKNFENCILFIFPFVTEHGFFNAAFEKQFFISLLDKYNITNYIICYAQPAKSLGAARKTIKKSREIFYDLVEIIAPKLIVTFDDSSAELFMNQKPNIIEDHGKVVYNYNDIPVILTYNIDYYNKRTGYEDDNYKISILKEDWKIISDYYNNLIES